MQGPDGEKEGAQTRRYVLEGNEAFACPTGCLSPSSHHINKISKKTDSKDTVHKLPKVVSHGEGEEFSQKRVALNHHNAEDIEKINQALLKGCCTRTL